MKKYELALLLALSCLILFFVFKTFKAVKFDNDDFETIVMADQSIAELIKEYSKNNSLKELQSIIERNGNRNEDRALLATADTMNDHVKLQTHFIEDLRYSSCKNVPATDKTESGKEFKKNYIFGKQQIINLKRKLDEAVNLINIKSSSSFATITNSSDNEQLNENDFWEYYFDNTPIEIALLTLNRLELQLLVLKEKGIKNIRRKLSKDRYTGQVVKPRIEPVSNEVYAGDIYEADLSLFWHYDLSELRISTTEGNIRRNEDGSSKVHFIANAKNLDKNGKAKKRFTVSISVTTPSGSDTTFMQTIEYVVKHK